MRGNRNNSDPRKWLRIRLDVPGWAVESVSDLLGVLSGSGVEISPETETGCTVSAFFPLSREPGVPPEDMTAPILHRLLEELAGLLELYDLPAPELTHELFDEEDWATSWQQYFAPFEITPGLVVRPSWEEYQPLPGQQVLEMDPGMAFGTGQHASTRMALALTVDSCRRLPPACALDVGTGTGILAMAAALSGATKIIALDNDPDAVRIATDNVRQNRLQEQVLVSGTPVTGISGDFELICANIVHDVLVQMAPVFGRLLAPGGRVILAGLLSGRQEESITRTYAALGMHPVRTLYEQEWAACLLHHRSS